MAGSNRRSPDSRTSSISSCQLCRARKVRCDRAGITCGPCRRLGLACSFGGAGQHEASMTASALGKHHSELTQAGTARRRALIACEACRVGKARCTGGAPCDRCSKRRVECIRRHRGGDGGDSQRPEERGQMNLQTKLTPSGSPTTSARFHPSLTTAIGASTNSPQVLSPKGLCRNTERQYIQTYFAGAKPLTCVFLHRPSTLAEWSQGKLDPVLTKALCASGRSIEAGPGDALARSWMCEVRDAVTSSLNRVSIQQLQTLVLVIQFFVQAGDTVEAWNLLPLAARLAFTLQLNYERPDLDPLPRECRCRLIWSVYLLDRLFSGGLEELATCPSEYLHIRLPCDERSFERGLDSQADFLNGTNQHGEMDAVAYLVRLYSTRERILRYTKGVRRERVSPIESANKLSALQSELDEFKASLPIHLRLEEDKLPLVAQSSDAQSFLIIHTMWFQCHCDLYRFFIPGIREPVCKAAAEATPQDYIAFCQRECLSKAVQLCDFWASMSRQQLVGLAEDLLLGVSIYQVAQILHHLHHLLPLQVPHTVDDLKTSLRAALNMDSTPRSRSSKVGKSLAAAEIIIDNLGQVRNGTRGSSPGDVHFLPSQGSLIPSAVDSSGLLSDVPVESIEHARPRLAAHAERILSITGAGPNNRIPQISSQPPTEAQAFSFDEGHIQWDPFDMELNDYYDVAADTIAFAPLPLA